MFDDGVFSGLILTLSEPACCCLVKTVMKSQLYCNSYHHLITTSFTPLQPLHGLLVKDETSLLPAIRMVLLGKQPFLRLFCFLYFTLGDPCMKGHFRSKLFLSLAALVGSVLVFLAAFVAFVPVSAHAASSSTVTFHNVSMPLEITDCSG